MARPSKYDIDLIERVTSLILKHGYNNKDLCSKIGISVETLSQWTEQESKRYKKKFAIAIITARETYLDNIVVEAESALIKLIKGHTIVETIEGANGVTAKEKEISPSITAIMYFLQNRAGEKWQDKHNIKADLNHTGSIDININSVGIFENE